MEKRPHATQTAQENATKATLLCGQPHGIEGPVQQDPRPYRVEPSQETGQPVLGTFARPSVLNGDPRPTHGTRPSKANSAGLGKATAENAASVNNFGDADQTVQRPVAQLLGLKVPPDGRRRGLTTKRVEKNATSP